MFRDYVRRLSESRFWISKWVVATAVLAVLLVIGIVFLLRQDIDFDTFLNYFALGLLIFVVITLFYVIIAIHDVPYEIAKKRNHPHQDAIHAAGWVSLFTLHVALAVPLDLGDVVPSRARLGLPARRDRSERFHARRQARRALAPGRCAGGERKAQRGPEAHRAGSACGDERSWWRKRAGQRPRNEERADGAPTHPDLRGDVRRPCSRSSGSRSTSGRCRRLRSAASS